MIEAVLVGCGAMSRAWLDAARQIDGSMSLACRPRRRRACQRATGSGRLTPCHPISLKPSTAPGRTWSDVVVPAARRSVALAAIGHGCHILSEPLAASSTRPARSSAARAAGRIAAVVQNRRHFPRPPHPPPGRERRHRWPTGVHADFLHRAAFRRFREEMDHVLLRHGDPHLRRGADDDRARCAAVFCHEWNPPNSVLPRGPRRRHLRDERARSSLSRRLVRRRRPDELGRRGGSSASRARSPTV